MKEFVAYSLETGLGELEGVVCVEAWDDRIFAGEWVCAAAAPGGAVAATSK